MRYSLFIANFFKWVDGNDWLMSGVVLVGVILIVCLCGVLGIEMPLIIR